MTAPVLCLKCEQLGKERIMLAGEALHFDLCTEHMREFIKQDQDASSNAGKELMRLAIRRRNEKWQITKK